MSDSHLLPGKDPEICVSQFAGLASKPGTAITSAGTSPEFEELWFGICRH